MIIVASQRGGAVAHGKHILNTRDNDHISVHEVRGYMAGDVMGALKEDQAIARGTKCKQHIYTASFNPPEDQMVSTDIFIQTIDGYEKHMKLAGQPRVIVFHEKEGRRHAHVSWSRIDRSTMTAKQMSHYKTRSKDYSRSLFLQRGWRMPEGLARDGRGNPQNYTLAEWQQAKRAGHNAKELKANIQDAWALSDNRASFVQALKGRGFYLARGNKGIHMAVTYDGHAVSIARQVKKPKKEIVSKLDDPTELRSIEETKAQIARDMMPVIKRHMNTHERKASAAVKALEQKRQALKENQIAVREKQKQVHALRWQQETQQRSERFRKGFKGLWDRLSGKHAALKKQNEQETLKAYERDKHEREAMIQKQIQERQKLQEQIRQERQRQAKERLTLYRDIERYKRLMPQHNQTHNKNRMEHDR